MEHNEYDSSPEDGNNTQYRIPDHLIGFHTITDYLPVSIGLYNKFLPNDYFKSLFKRIENADYSKINIGENVSNQYKEELDKLKSFIVFMLDRYKSQVKETNITESIDAELFKQEKHTIIDKLITMDDINDEIQDKKYSIKYITTEPHPKYTEKYSIIRHIDKDILELIERLYTIYLYSKNLNEEITNSFKKFCENIIIHMRANKEVFYPKSIVNYTCFMYSIIGYPYCTPTRRIYSINNYINNLDNKFNNVIIYMKNTDALISYLYDIQFKEEADEIMNEEWLLRVAYCICIALLAYRCEFIEYQTSIYNIFGTRVGNK
jgi:hypothetical protein